jgi:Outer membrane protein beta-barrel domain
MFTAMSVTTPLKNAMRRCKPAKPSFINHLPVSPRYCVRAKLALQNQPWAQADATYKLGACDIGVGRKLGRDGVAKELMGKYVPYSPDMAVNAYSDRAGKLVRLSMQQCDNWFSDSMPRPVPAPVRAAAPAPAPVVAAPPAPVPAPAPVVAPVKPVPAPMPVAAVVAPVAARAFAMSPYVFGGIAALRDGGQLTATTPSYQHTNLAGQIGAGLQLTPQIGAELAYQAAKKYTPLGSTGIKSNDLLGRVTFGDEVTKGVRVFGKLGAQRMRHTTTGLSNSQTRPTAGLGLTTDVAKDLKLRVDYDHLFSRGKTLPTFKAADYLGLGAQYNF